MSAPLRCSLAILVALACSSPTTPTVTIVPKPVKKDTIEDADTATDTADDSVDPDTEVPPIDEGPIDTSPPPPPPPTYVECDAGAEAWVKRTLTGLMGRKPAGIREVRALVDLLAQTDRATVARAMMKTPAYMERWSQWLMDEIRVNRIGDKKHDDCYDAPKQTDDLGEVAIFVRDNDPRGSKPGIAFNMTDVLHSSLRLDDLTPFYRAHLFAMMKKPITGANVAALEMDITRRQDFGEIFEATYLHRSTVCSSCHNSNWSTTDNSDPELDRHWPIEGLFEQSIYGSDTGRPEMEVFSVFRHLNVVSDKVGIRPWNIDSACGRFKEPVEIPDDPANFSAYFIKELGLSASIWDVETALREGIELLRIDGLNVDPDTLEIDGREAFAYMLSVRIVNRVWREIMGFPLTLVHYFPRNKFQRDILMELTNHFIAEGWSLKTLLVDILTHPLYNESAASDACGPDHPYLLPPVFNPWSTAEPEEHMQSNSVGDQLHRLNARVLLSSVSYALEWPKTPTYPGGADNEFQKAVGVFVKDGEPGFSGVDFQGVLAWENRFGACVSQVKAEFGDEKPSSCVGYCGGKSARDCYCDDQCESYGDCCEDYEEVCVKAGITVKPGGPDWISRLIKSALLHDAGASGSAPLTVYDIASAIKDRLITTPDTFSKDEQQLIANLFDVPNVFTSLTKATGWQIRARYLCGVLLESPDFLLTGIAPSNQTSQPKLVVGPTRYLDHCLAWAPLVLDADKQPFECGTESITVSTPQ